MKLGRISGVAVFLGAGLVGAVLARPAVAQAGGLFRQYSPQMCVFAGAPDPNEQFDFFTGVAQNLGSGFAGLICPIVEDESVHVKGAATTHFILSEVAGNDTSFYGVCKTYQAQDGGTCSGFNLTDLNPDDPRTAGVHQYSAKSANFWASSTDFGYLVIGLGGRSTNNRPNKLQGYWVTN
jgi:hypothetical protein